MRPVDPRSDIARVIDIGDRDLGVVFGHIKAASDRACHGLNLGIVIDSVRVEGRAGCRRIWPIAVDVGCSRCRVVGVVGVCDNPSGRVTGERGVGADKALSLREPLR